jgi:small subunit ribosomal protein S13
MARISGVDLPRDKKVVIGLSYIYGIGRKSAADIVEKAGVDSTLRVRDLTDADVNKIRGVIERDHKVEGALRTEVAMNIKRLMDIGSYRGIRAGFRCAASARIRTRGRRRVRVARSQGRRRSRSDVSSSRRFAPGGSTVPTRAVVAAS